MYSEQMFRDMQHANMEVHMSTTQGVQEKCVDIALAVEMMHFASVEGAYDCAVLLSGAQCALHARGCTFANTRAAVASERGGHVDVRGCTFDLGHAQDVGLRLAADTTGTVVDNPADRRRLWGPFVPPAGVHTDAAELED